MRWIGIIAVAAVFCLPAPAEAWRKHGRPHHGYSAGEHYVTPYAMERGYSAAPGRGLVNTLMDETHAPAVRHTRPPGRGYRPRVIKPHGHHEVRRTAPNSRSEEMQREAKPQSEALRREPEPLPKVTTPKAPLTETEKPKPAAQTQAAAAPPQKVAAPPATQSEADEPSHLHGEAAAVARQREEWLNGLTQQHGFERW
jgi:hypothetical protein